VSNFISIPTKLIKFIINFTSSYFIVFNTNDMIDRSLNVDRSNDFDQYDYFNVLLLFIQTSSQVFDTVILSSGDKQIISNSISLKIKKKNNKFLKKLHKIFS
jgi:hypothetical protein